MEADDIARLRAVMLDDSVVLHGRLRAGLKLSRLAFDGDARALRALVEAMKDPRDCVARVAFEMIHLERKAWKLAAAPSAN
jgi:hypothetical protein